MKTAIYTVPFSLNLTPAMFDEIKRMSDEAQISMADKVRHLIEFGFRYQNQIDLGDQDE